MNHAHNRSGSEPNAGRVGAKRRVSTTKHQSPELVRGAPTSASVCEKTPNKLGNPIEDTFYRVLETKRACMWPRSLDFDTLRYSIGARSDQCYHAPTRATERFRAAVSRVRQFLAAVRARVSEGEMVILEQHLDPSQRDLFQAMSPIDQRHCLDVFNALLRQGHPDPDLLRAALLHDIGKRGIHLWHRVAGVLLEAFWPTLLEKLAVNCPQSWLYGFYIYRHHAELSAELAERSGCSASVVELIRGHHSPLGNEQAQALWDADRLS